MEKTKKSCYTRRRFLCSCCTMAGAAALAPYMVSCSGAGTQNKKNCPKVKVVFGLQQDVQVTPDWPNIGYDMRAEMKAMTDCLNATVPDVEFVPAKSSGEEQSAAILEKDNAKGGIDGYIVIQLNTGVDALGGILDNTDKPVLYAQMPYGGDGVYVQRLAKYLREGAANFAFISAVNFEDVAKVATAFSRLNGGSCSDVVKAANAIRLEMTPKTPVAKKKADNLKVLSPEETLKKLKGRKILSVEREIDEDYVRKVKELLGVEIERVTLDEVNEETARVDKAAARALCNEWKSKADSIKDVPDETIFDAARLYYAMKGILKKHNADSITIDCLTGVYSKKLCAYPCLGFMQLQDEGLLGICENDIDSTLTMMVFGAMTGRMGYISDPVLDSSSRSIIYSHCVSTRKYFGEDGPESPYEILTHSEDRDGASVRVIAPIGYPVTTLKFNFGEGTMAVHTGTVTGNSKDDRACRTKIIVEVDGDYEKIYRQWDHYIWHRVTFYGDFAKEAAAFAQKIGFEVRPEC